MDIFKERYEAFITEFGKAKLMVLSTAENNLISSRMMSVVQIDGLFYFQTDKTLRKYSQLMSNPRVALCIDNIQIEGICNEVGHPMEHVDFCDVFKECNSGSYDRYTALENERLFAVTPIYLERWIYKDGVPFVEIFDIAKGQYELREYRGV